jgi:hypothetical protein
LCRQRFDFAAINNASYQGTAIASPLRRMLPRKKNAAAAGKPAWGGQ